MSKATEEFKNLMESDRGEQSFYEKAHEDIEIPMPITRAGFEALVERACKLCDIPKTNPMRNTAVGFLHHIETTKCTTSIKDLGAALWNTVSNHMTYTIDQEIKAEANKELAEEREKARLAVEELEKQRKIEAAQEKRAKKSAKKGRDQANEAGA